VRRVRLEHGVMNRSAPWMEHMNKTDSRPEFDLLINRFIESLEEIALRFFSEEIDFDQIRRKMKSRKMSQPVVELLKLLASLEQFEHSIAQLTDGDSGNARESGTPGAPAVDMEKILEDFDDVDIFSEYREGDAVYGTEYEADDQKILNELFFQILDGYLDPIVVGFRALISGNTNIKLVEALLASIRPLRRSADTMGFRSLHQAFCGMESQLEATMSASVVRPIDRIQLLQSFDQLARLLPRSTHHASTLDVMDPEATSHSLILSLVVAPGVEGWMVQTLLEVGIFSPQRLLAATSSDIQAVTGLPADKCLEILTRCRRAYAESQSQFR